MMMHVADGRPRLGELLVELGLLDREKLRLALAAQRRERERLGQTLIRLGLLTRRQLELALFEQYRRCIAGAVGLAILSLQPSPAAAGGNSATLTLSGRVAPRSSIQLAEAPAEVSLPRLGVPMDFRLARVFQESNNDNGYAVTMVSESARAVGETMLIGPDGQTGVPYRLIDGGREVKFVDGEAQVGVARGTGRAGSELRIALPATHAADGATYADTLRFIVRAN